MATDSATQLEATIEEQSREENIRREALDRKVDDAKVEGWKVSKEQGDRVIMKKPNYGTMGGHILIALLTIWWTLGIGNALYAAYKYFSDSDTRVIRVD